MWASGIRVCLAAYQCYPYGQPCQRDVKVLSYSLLNTAWSLQKVQSSDCSTQVFVRGLLKSFSVLSVKGSFKILFLDVGFFFFLSASVVPTSTLVKNQQDQVRLVTHPTGISSSANMPNSSPFFLSPSPTNTPTINLCGSSPTQMSNFMTHSSMYQSVFPFFSLLFLRQAEGYLGGSTFHRRLLSSRTGRVWSCPEVVDLITAKMCQTYPRVLNIIREN